MTTPPLVSPHLSRGIHLIPLLALVDGFGAMILIDWMKRAWHTASLRIVRYFSLILLIGLFSLTALEFGFRYKNYFTAYTFRSDVRSYFRYGLDDALLYALAHQSEYDEIWITDVDQPYIYLLFYARWPSSDVHSNLEVLRAPPAFNELKTFGKYHFGELPAVNPHDLVLLYRTQDSESRTLYQVRGGMMSERGRVLFIDKP